MGGGKGMSAPEAPTNAPTMPTEETLTEDEERAKLNEERRQALKEGYTDTILTSTLGGEQAEKAKTGGM